MSLSKRSIDTLIDLVEIKISYMDVADREDARELHVLESCRNELKSLASTAPASAERRVGRPRTSPSIAA